MHHEIMLALLEGKLHLAPIEDPERILDIGTGTGIWATGNHKPLRDVSEKSSVTNIERPIDDLSQTWPTFTRTPK
jgi:methylase of polypeptide subunit release factors